MTDTSYEVHKTDGLQIQDLKRDLTKMTSSCHQLEDNNAALSSEILRTKNLYHSSLIEGDDERARHQRTIQVLDSVDFLGGLSFTIIK